MGRSLSPILRRELENLDKDADSRRSAMKALKSYVKDLDSKAIPIFLAHVSETKQTGISPGEHTISLYEVLARVHGPKIVPQIDNIMKSIVRTLSLSAGAFALHQACSKVVPAIARYAIDPTTPEDRKKHVIQSLCKPLSDCLLSGQENLSSGAALCLQALVESDNWRFSSSEMVNEVCQRVAGALENHSQANFHMALVTALTKHNSLIVEAYARLLIHSGLQILDDGFAKGNSQKQLSAIHMVSSLMKCLDPRSLLSELGLVIREMEKCQADRMPFVTGAAFEALQIAKKIWADKGSKLDKDTSTGSSSGSNTRRMMHVCSSGEQSPYPPSPESQTVDSLMGYDYYIESPKSMDTRHQSSDCRNSNRKLWRRCENGILDVSLKDGIFSNIVSQGSSDVFISDYDDPSQNRGDYLENFSGFSNGNLENGAVGSITPSPKRSNSHINVDDVNIFSTPRRLIRSLQDVDNFDSDFSKKQARRFRSPMAITSMHGQNGRHQDVMMNCKKYDRDNFYSGDDEFQGSSESVATTKDDFSDEDQMLLPAEGVVPGHKAERVQFPALKNRAHIVVYGLSAVLFAVLLCLLAGDRDDGNILLVPT